MLKIVAAPNNILTTPALPVTDFGESLQQLIKEMEKTLCAQTDPPGVGLAAPQVGVNLTLFITKPSVKKKDVYAYVNPKILNKVQSSNTKSSSKSKTQKRKRQPLEGCLSVARIWGPVRRAAKVRLEYHTPAGDKKVAWFSGFEATIIQHEVDHLNGILFTQRVLEQKNLLYEEKDGKLKKMEY